MINTEKTFGILAYPATHSLSPVIHNAGFKKLNLPYNFEVFDVPPEELGAFMSSLKDKNANKCKNIHGFSVSMPHKQAIIPFLDEIDEDGQAVGAISCVYRKDDKFIGTNLDYIGGRDSISQSNFYSNFSATSHSDSTPISYSGTFTVPGRRKAIVLGAGGAAAAAIYGLKQLNITPILFNRTFKKAEEIADRFNKNSKGPFVEAFPLSEINNVLNANSQDQSSDIEIIINCTSLGLEKDLKIVPDEAFSKMKLALDAIYSDKPTIFQIQALEIGNNGQGAELLTGLDWLLHQGYKAFEIWTEHPAPKGVMSETIK